MIPPTINPNGQLDQGVPVDAADKEFADVDPETGRVLLTWTNFTSTTGEISATYSDNILTGTPTWQARRLIAASAADGQASIPHFARASANAYVAWSRFPPAFFGYGNKKSAVVLIGALQVTPLSVERANPT